MLIDKETLRLIFGIKLRSLREEKNLSLKDLSKKTGLSPSYLNEIEKGKKYPKTEKIISLAHALEQKYEDLISLELKKELQILQKLMDKKVFKALPFDFFGIPTNTLVELIAESPEKMGALVGTILEIARAHNIKIDDIFFALLHSYIDMNGNYFPELEESAQLARLKFKIDAKDSAELTKEKLESILQSEFQVQIIEEKMEKVLYFVKDKGKTLYISDQTDLTEKIFILARELAYHYLKLQNRPFTSMVAQLDSFEQLKNHFSASYFASSLLIPFDSIAKECEALFQNKKFDIEALQQILKLYPVPTESIFHRLTQVLPKHFGVQHLFFLRYEFDPRKERYEISRELHLTSLHSPHRVKGNENYCARWLVNRLTKSVISSDEKAKLGVQLSHFYDNQNEYLIIAGAFKPNPNTNETTSVCLGLLSNEHLKTQLQFLNSDSITKVTVGETCERCSVPNCSERKAPKEVPLEQLLGKFQ